MSTVEIFSLLCNIATFLIAILAFRKYTEVKVISDLNKQICWIKKTIVDRDGTSWWSKAGGGSSLTIEGIGKIIIDYRQSINEDEKKLIKLYSDVVFRFNDGNEIESVQNIIFFLRNLKSNLHHEYNNGEFKFEPTMNDEKKREFNRIYDNYKNDIDHIQSILHWKNSFNQL